MAMFNNASTSTPGTYGGSALGLPQYNATSISDFLRQQLAEQAKRRRPQRSNPMPMPGAPSTGGVMPAPLGKLFG